MPKTLYPLFLDIRESLCLVVGAGRVGTRKISGLLRGGVKQILVIDPISPLDQWEKFLCQELETKRILFFQRKFQEKDLIGVSLVFATTNNNAVNAEIMLACHNQHLLCNSATNPDDGNFFVPARVDSGNISLAISTGGGSPALSAHLRQELEILITERYDRLCRLLDQIRPKILALRLDAKKNSLIFRNIVQSDLADSLAARDIVAACHILKNLLPQELHGNIFELVCTLTTP